MSSERKRILDLCKSLEKDADRDNRLSKLLSAKACEELESASSLREKVSQLNDYECEQVTKDWVIDPKDLN